MIIWTRMGWIIYVFWIYSTYWIDKNIAPLQSLKGLIFVALACFVEAMLIGRLLNRKSEWAFYGFTDTNGKATHTVGNLRAEWSGLIIVGVAIFIIFKEHL